jgi:hypothetical protein
MSTISIALIVVGYLICTGVCGAIFYAGDPDATAFYWTCWGLLWPLAVAALLVVGAAYVVAVPLWLLSRLVKLVVR